VGSAISVRSATVDDVAVIVRLSAELGYPVTAIEVANRLAAAHAAERHAVLVAEVAGRVVGWPRVHYSLLIQAPPGAELGGLGVAEGDRGAGVGRSPLAAAEDWAQSREHHITRIRSRTTRRPAHGFYLNAGYQKVKTSFTFEKRLG